MELFRLHSVANQRTNALIDIHRYAESLGMILDDRKFEQYCLDRMRWNGHSISRNLRPKDLLHEVCHWILATKEDRTKHNFGLVRAYEQERGVLFLEETLSIRFGIYDPIVHRMDREIIRDLIFIRKILRDL